MDKIKVQFLANMSHEIRTPMHAISGMTKILKRNKYLPTQSIYLDAINQSSANLLVILNDILDMSKIEAGKLVIEAIPMSPQQVLQNVIDILKFKAEEKGLELRTHIEADFPKQIINDPTRLAQVLMNLTGNAIKFTENGSVRIELSQSEQDGKALLQFAVKDTGIGIPAEKLDSIFGSFEQVEESTTRKYGGTGLGLSICRQIVQLQQGRIWVESDLGKGSTFYFNMPLIIAEGSDTSRLQLTDKDLQDLGAKLERIRILVAEDNAFNRMIAQDDLSFYFPKVNIDTAENGQIAVDKFKNNQYDLILMDIHMPEMDGHQASRHIRQLESLNPNIAKPIPILALTASLLKSEIESCYEAGMNNYIPKPYKAEELVLTICEEMEKVNVV